MVFVFSGKRSDQLLHALADPHPGARQARGMSLRGGRVREGGGQTRPLAIDSHRHDHILGVDGSWRS